MTTEIPSTDYQPPDPEDRLLAGLSYDQWKLAEQLTHTRRLVRQLRGME